MDFATAQQAAKGKWLDVLGRFGIDGKYLTGKHGPCPICGGKDRFRFDNKRDRGSWICSACGAGDGFTLVSKFKKVTLVEAKNLIEPLLADFKAKPKREPVSDESAKKKALDFWDKSVAVANGDPVWTYLVDRLGQPIDSPSIRINHSTHPSDNARYWVMAAGIHSADGNIVSVHRTFLDQNGKQAKHLFPVKMLMKGTLPHGSAIRLCKLASHLGIAEGIETALAAHLMTGIPTWSVISAPFMKTWEPPKGVKKLTIFSDNDVSFTGQAAAYDLAKRLTLRGGITVDVRVPQKKGEDWADYWRRNKDEGI